MELTIIEWRGEVWIVIGIGYDTRIDPPDIYTAVPFTGQSLIQSVLYPVVVKIPIAEAIEITDEKRLRAMWVLFGGK